MNDKAMQKMLSKLISEELVAYEFYVGCTLAAQKDVARCYSKMFIDIAKDERDDHAKRLAEWAASNDFKVPYKFKDIEKAADEKAVKLLNSLKEDQNAKYYVSKAIASEKAALESYQKAMEADMPYDLEQILLQNYYDEVEHFQKLDILLNAIEAGAELV